MSAYRCEVASDGSQIDQRRLVDLSDANPFFSSSKLKSSLRCDNFLSVGGVCQR